MIVRKSRAVEDKKDRQYKEEVEEEFLSFLLLYACMHFVCSLYAFPYAYIYALSALRTRLFAFLYALYAVNSGVVFSHSMHSRFFDAYNAYKPFLGSHSRFSRPPPMRCAVDAYGSV